LEEDGGRGSRTKRRAFELSSCAIRF